MRIYILWTLVAALAVYAWRNWFVPACGLILLSVVMQRRDFPQHLLGINGLNPWNILLVITVLAWFIYRRRIAVPLDVPRKARLLLVTFFIMIFIAYLRAVYDIGSIKDEWVGFTGDFLINRLKFVVPALLLFDACRTRRRLRIAAGVVLFVAFAYAVFVIKHIPLSSLLSSSEGDFMQYRHRIDRDIGLMAIDMSMLLAGSFWALCAFIVMIVRRRVVQLVLMGPLAALMVGMGLCHSRGSYIGFVAAGLVLAIARWRKLLLIIPVAVAIIFVALPAIPARLGMGFGDIDIIGEEVQNWDVITAGRLTDLWPPTIDQIAKGPLVGFGGVACRRTELQDKWMELGGAVTHPHNAYLETLLDMGIVGFIPVMGLYGGIFVVTLRLFRNRTDRFIAGVGGMGLACITVLLVTALGAQSFYPTQSTLPFWCMWALALRAVVEQSRALKLDNDASHQRFAPIAPPLHRHRAHRYDNAIPDKENHSR